MLKFLIEKEFICQSGHHFAAVGLCASRTHSRKFLCTHSGIAAVYLCLPVVGTTYIYRYAKPNCSHVGIGFGSANAHHTDVWNDLSHRCHVGSVAGHIFHSSGTLVH